MARKKTSRSKSRSSSLTPRLAGGTKRAKPKPPPKPKARPKARNEGPRGFDRWWNGLSHDSRVIIGGLVLGAILLAAIIGGGIWAFKAMERHVLDQRAAMRIRHLRITFADEPFWLANSTLDRIRRRSVAISAKFEDAQFLGAINDALVADPWVRRVERITKAVNPQDPALGEIMAACEFRQPVAKIQREGVGMGQGPATLYLADDGVVLPAEEVAKYVDIASIQGDYRRVRVYAAREHVPAGTVVDLLHFPIIDGGQSGPATAGARWASQDIVDALTLAKALQGKPYANQIQRIRIADGRPRCDLTLEVTTDDGRQIEVYFGRLATGETDYVVPMATRIAWLDEFVAPMNGRIGGVNRYINLRRDQLYVD